MRRYAQPVTPGSPLGPSALAFALPRGGSILVNLGPAASRTIAVGSFQKRVIKRAARSGTVWVVTTHTGGHEKEGGEPGFLQPALQVVSGPHDNHSEDPLPRVRPEMPQVSSDEV